MDSLFRRMGPFDLDTLMDYMSAVRPIASGIEHRIKKT